MEFLTKGKRGEVYLDKHKGKTVVIKQQRKDSKAIHRLENEMYWLKKLNKHKIGPKFTSFKEGKLMMEYVQGEAIRDYLKKKKLSKKLAKELLEQCRVMDKLKVNKLEMHHPFKHVIIKKGALTRKHVVMIDFEKCKQTEKPKNVTQVCQYLTKHGIKIDRKALQQYKKDYSLSSFRNLLMLLL